MDRKQPFMLHHLLYKNIFTTIDSEQYEKRKQLTVCVCEMLSKFCRIGMLWETLQMCICNQKIEMTELMFILKKLCVVIHVLTMWKHKSISPDYLYHNDKRKVWKKLQVLARSAFLLFSFVVEKNLSRNVTVIT